MPAKTRDVRFELRVRAKPDQVYRALTSARELCRWWLLGAETDARSVGRVRMVWPRPARGEDVFPRNLGELEGSFVDLEPGRKVAWLWKVSARLKNRRVPLLTSVFITPKARSCEVTLVHSGFLAAPSSDSTYLAFSRGWGDALAKLKLYLETGGTCKADTLAFPTPPKPRHS